ncbi:MAG: 2-oxo-4-hydroxy-4-carboxy-5-ureidoimidazoline decarboxylase [Acidobacteria bacterium]|nr:2-oxo-4-hydroxy-4-carboxy-5-ureidoimidazoline decarboxylase [Acidobacteriota bacterium]
MRQGIERLNNLSSDEAAAGLSKCCGSSRWAREVASRRPFRHAGELLNVADEVWSSLDPRDWLEAFSHHPQIGGRRAEAAQTAEERAWSAEEQSGVSAADGETRDELARLNREYEEKFGHIFIVCATGKTPAEMLSLLRARLPNERAAELRVAAEEQRRITRLRIEKLLAP